jgi:hypothetical protein
MIRAYPMKCLPNEMRSLFHRGEAYLCAWSISSGRSLLVRPPEAGKPFGGGQASGALNRGVPK